MDGITGLGGRWLTSKEAAAMLRVHPKHIYRLLRKGLPAQRVGGQWRFYAAELERWARGERGEHPGAMGNIGPQTSTQHDVDMALVLSRDDLAVHALVEELNRRAPPAVGVIAHDDARPVAWLEQPSILAAAVLGDFVAPTPVQLAWLHIAHEQFGLIGPPSGTPPELAAMTRRRVRVAGWPPGSDLRVLVDGVLLRDGLDGRAAHASALLCTSHAEVVAAVVRGDAHVGVTTAAWAIRFGLPFRPLGSRPLGLVAPASALGHPVLIRCWEALQTLAFRNAIERAGGYDATDAGLIRYLRPDSAKPAPLPGGRETAPRGANTNQTRWALVIRDRGVDASGAILRAVARLRAQGHHVGGFVQVPRRARTGVVGYDAQRVAGRKRVPLASRAAPVGAGPVLAYRSFEFHDDMFAKTREWLLRDAVKSDVLVIDGIGTRESEGGGHFEALAWASRLPSPTLVIACVRRDRIETIVDTLQLAGRVVALLETPVDASSAQAFEASVVAAAGR